MIERLVGLTVFPEITPERSQLLVVQYLQQYFVFCFPDFFDGAKAVEEFAGGDLPDTGNLVQFGSKGFAAPLLSVEGDAETVGFIPQLLNDPQRFGFFVQV